LVKKCHSGGILFDSSAVLEFEKDASSPGLPGAFGRAGMTFLIIFWNRYHRRMILCEAW
jgi:hypothetical protein